MILFLAFMVGFFSGYNEFTRNATLSVLDALFCIALIGGIILFIGSCLLIMFSEVKPAVQGMMAITAALGVFAIIASAYDSYRKEKLLKLQKDLECERCKRRLEF